MNLRRRPLIAGGAALMAARLTLAQQPKKTRTLGLFGVGPRPTPKDIAESPTLARLRELGWTEGGNLTVERSYAEGKANRLRELATELVAKLPDVIWTANPEAAIAAARATRTIPIVFWSVPYPVEQGLIDSLARPGRNVTGVAFFQGQNVALKRLELLRNCAPTVKRVAWIQSGNLQETMSGGRPYGSDYDALLTAAQKLGFELQYHSVDTRENFDIAFDAILHSLQQAFVLGYSELLLQHRKLIVDFAMRHRLPNVYASSQFVEAGGLASYGPDQVAMAVYSMSYVDKILRGAKPADLPVEIPNRYVLALNLKTAKELGLTLPQSLLLRADEVIQ